MTRDIHPTSASFGHEDPLVPANAAIEAETGNFIATSNPNSEIYSFGQNLGKLIGTVGPNGEDTEYSYPLDRLAGYIYHTGQWLLSNIMQAPLYTQRLISHSKSLQENKQNTVQTPLNIQHTISKHFDPALESQILQFKKRTSENQVLQSKQRSFFFENDRRNIFPLEEGKEISQEDMTNVFSMYFDYLERMILDKKESARRNGKELLILVGEAHESYAENYIQHIIFHIAKKLKINNFYHERSGDLDLSNEVGCDLHVTPFMVEDIEVAQKYNMNYVPIDLWKAPSYLYHEYDRPGITPEGVIERNKKMIQELEKHAQAGVAIVGGKHMIGLCSDLEGHRGINREIYEVLEINLFDNQDAFTIRAENHKQAERYYSAQNSILFSMIKNIDTFMALGEKPNKSIKHKIITVERAFSDFMENKDKSLVVDNNFLTRKAFKAVRFGDELVLQKILSSGFNINARNCQGYDFLQMAILNSNFGMAKFLLKNGIDSTIDRALMLAVAYGQTQMVSGFLEAGANVNAETDGFTPLHHCAQSFGRVEMIKILLANGANIDAKSQDHFTPLYLAVINREAENAMTLLDAGADTALLPTEVAKKCEFLQQLPVERRTRRFWR